MEEERQLIGWLVGILVTAPLALMLVFKAVLSLPVW